MSRISCHLEIVEILLQMHFARQIQWIFVALTNLNTQSRKERSRTWELSFAQNRAALRIWQLPCPFAPRVSTFVAVQWPRSWGFSLFVWFVFFPRAGALWDAWARIHRYTLYLTPNSRLTEKKEGRATKQRRWLQPGGNFTPGCEGAAPELSAQGLH